MDLRIRLLGGFSVEVDGALVDDRAWRLRKARSLVKLLALAPGRHLHRDVVCEALWPDRDAAAAANNLHQALHAARRALGDPSAVALVDGTLALTPDAWVDVDAFEHEEEPHAALALYAGDLLPEDRYEEWTTARREALGARHVDLSVRVAEAHPDPAAAAALLARATAQAPLHEPAVRALMRALAAAGRRQEALAAFERLRTHLRDELAADPDPETRALYRELLPGEAAPAATGRLPEPLTSFVGRARELHEVGRLLERARLVTLTGPGGAGKTRLAIEAARACGDAWFADLGVLRDPADVPQAVATALGVPIPAHRPALDALTAHLAQRRLLLVLDTCEHLLDACAHLAETLLAASPGVRLLATSREPLRCAAEVAWRVPSLAEAPTLFRERAAAVRSRPFTAIEEGVIADICWRLDGMPLAVELAAARTGALTVDQIAARLGDALDVLSAGARTALTRQQTLRATIDWSHDLLTGDERVLFRRVAVFAGAFSLEAAEAVASGAPIATRRIADLVARLVDKSLIGVEGGCFRLIDTIRQFGEERLDASGERDAVARRHLDWCLTAAAARRTPRGIEADQDDVRAALTFALRHDPQAGLELARRLWRFWMARSWFAEGTRWIDAVLHAAPERTALRVEVLMAAAAMALRRGDPDVYLARAAEAVSVYRDLGDREAMAEALHQHALFEGYVHSSTEADGLFAEALAAAERHDDPGLAASVVHGAALAPWYRSEVAIAHERIADAIERLHALPAGPERFFHAVSLGQPVLPIGLDGEPRLTWDATLVMFHRLDREEALVLAYNNLAWILRVEGDTDAAREQIDHALHHARACGDEPGEALTLGHLGHLLRTTGELDLAREHLAAGIDRFRAFGERRDADVLALGLGLAHGDAGDVDQARATFGTALGRFVATEDSPAIAGAHGVWGLMEERTGALDEAHDHYALSAAGWIGQGLGRIGGWCAYAAASMSHRLGAAEDALAEASAARDLLAAAGNARGVAACDALLAAHSALSGCKEPRP